METKTIKISEENYNKILDIKELRGYKSINDVITEIIPKGIDTTSEFEIEAPAFVVGETPVSWNMLRNANINSSWSDGDETAIILFKDNYGVLVRFQYGEEFFINYYHFI